MSAAIQASVKKYKNLGYNKAALAFIEAGDNDTKNLCCKAAEAVIAISPPATTLPKLELPLMGNCTTSIASRKRWKTTGIRVKCLTVKVALCGVNRFPASLWV